jgi:fructose-1,6-bisphosphatase/inositol monophosphatase family enzyme
MNSRALSQNIDVTDLCNAGIWAARAAMGEIFNYIESYPEEAFETERVGVRQKKALAVDRSAERIFKGTLNRYSQKRFSAVEVYGEETLAEPDLDLYERSKDENSIFALVDMVDGTDLLERRLSNWCSAGILFRPKAKEGERIIAAFVGLPTKEIYYAKLGEDKVYVQSPDRKTFREVAGPSPTSKLENASVCFYGQKGINLLSVFTKPNDESVSRESLIEYVGRLQAERKKRREEKQLKGEPLLTEDEDLAFRIYNLAGIPMMVKLTDHQVKNAKNIDVVFDVKGQNPHDVIPGVYLAKKAGAIVRQFIVEENKEREKRVKVEDLTYETMEASLIRPASPASKLKYLVASTKELADQLEPLLLPLI